MSLLMCLTFIIFTINVTDILFLLKITKYLILFTVILVIRIQYFLVVKPIILFLVPCPFISPTCSPWKRIFHCGILYIFSQERHSLSCFNVNFDRNEEDKQFHVSSEVQKALLVRSRDLEWSKGKNISW